jgi:hypothetical protein
VGPKLSFVTRYAPPADGYSLIVSRYDRIRNPNTTHMAIVMGITRENAMAPATGSSTWRISSVAYADDDRLSEAKTASAVGLPRRWCSSSSLCSGAPRSRRLRRYEIESGGRGTPGSDGIGSGTGPGRSVGAVVVATGHAPGARGMPRER